MTKTKVSSKAAASPKAPPSPAKEPVVLIVEVDPVSWTPDYLSFRSLRWQGNTPAMRRSSAGRW
jgi:hypothetical protein